MSRPQGREERSRGVAAVVLALAFHLGAAGLAALLVPALVETWSPAHTQTEVILVSMPRRRETVERPAAPDARPAPDGPLDQEPEVSPLHPRRRHRPELEATLEEQHDPGRTSDAQPSGPSVLPRIPSPREAAVEIVLGPEAARSDDERDAAHLDARLRSGLPGLPDDDPEPSKLDRDREGNLLWDDEDFGGRLHRATLGKLHRRTSGPGDADEVAPHDQGYPERRPIKGTIHPDGTVEFERVWGVDISDEQVQITDIEGDCFSTVCEEARMGLAGTLQVPMRMLQDINDVTLLIAGEDPHLAQKRRFLEQTEPLRHKLAKADRADRLAVGYGKLAERLDAMWRDPSLSHGEKRRLLFALWDECEEPPSDDPPTVEQRHGRRSREQVLTFIRRALPAGSPEAYRPAELHALNASRHSAQRFEPYR